MCDVLSSAEAIPANPDNEYGWEELYAERMAQTYSRHYPIKVRIARFQNCYGPEGTWTGGREKAPAVICRKVAQAEDGGRIEVWGDGSAVRSYTYISDMVDGIYMLMQSDPSISSGQCLEGAVNIGCPQYVTVDELAATVAEVSGREILMEHIDGPVGVQSRNSSNVLIAAMRASTRWGGRRRCFLKRGFPSRTPGLKHR